MGLYSLPPHKLTCHLFPIRVFPLWFFMSLYTTELPDQSSWDATRSSELSMAPSEASNDTPASFPRCQSHPQGQVFPSLVPLRHFRALAVNILRWLAPRALLTIFIGPDGSDSPHLQCPPFPWRDSLALGVIWEIEQGIQSTDSILRDTNTFCMTWVLVPPWIRFSGGGKMS